jgi:hypothetical protein
MSRVRIHFDIPGSTSNCYTESMDLGPDMSGEENRVRVLIEKKTVLNLIDGFCVAVKHYLRGETGAVCTQWTLMGFDDMSLQTSIMRICITRPNIFHHTHYLRVCRPVATLQVICLLQSPSRSSSSRLFNATLPTTVDRDPIPEAVVSVNPPLRQPPTFPCLPLLLDRLRRMKSWTILIFRSRHELLEVTQAFMAVRW